MKGRLKDRVKQIGLIVLFLVISVISISLISGRTSTQQIIVVKKDGININLPLDQQLEYFQTKYISVNEMKYFQGTVVTDINQLRGKVVSYPLKAGNPIPLSALTSPKGAGQFAAVMPKGRTVHLLPNATTNLPPVSEGDLINIALSYKAKDNSGNDVINIGMLMTDVKIYKIVGNNVYVDVNLEEDMVLSSAAQLGSFIYQIPGQKDQLCSNSSNSDCSSGNDDSVPTNIQQSDIFNAIQTKKYFGVDSETLTQAVQNPVGTVINGTSNSKKNSSNNSSGKNTNSVSSSDTNLTNNNVTNNSSTGNNITSSGGANNGQQQN